MSLARSLRLVAGVLLPILAVLASPGPASAGPGPDGEPLAHTYSIVARDPATGQLGVAVQSHWFQVGRVVSWARAGVGAVATQSFSEIDYGPRGLALMESGLSSEQALARLLQEDEGRAVRQVAMVGADGGVAVHTGERCIPAAGHRVGDDYAVQANLMVDETVWDAMAEAFEEAGGDLAERMLVALEAAQARGGDLRGRQSAALLVVGGETSDRPWRDVVVDLRVDDAPRPLEELRRLLTVHRAYEAMNLGDEALADDRVDEAAGHYGRGVELLPERLELAYWQGVTLWTSGEEERATPVLRDVFARDDRWIELTRRLPASGLATEEQVDGMLGLVEWDAPAASAGDREPPEVTIRGLLTDEGIECPSLRDDEGRLWTLAGNLRGLSAGDRVEVEGDLARYSICMQGTTIDLRSIRRAALPES